LYGRRKSRLDPLVVDLDFFLLERCDSLGTFVFVYLHPDGNGVISRRGGWRITLDGQQNVRLRFRADQFECLLGWK
jgi:hypothetical protein